MNEIFKVIFVVFGTVLISILMSIIFAFPVQYLWNNCAVHAISGIKEVSLFEAWGITMLCGLLFGGAKNASS